MSSAALFLGGHPALDFINTSFAPSGVPTEVIGDGSALLDWMASAGLIEPAAVRKLANRFGAKSLDAVAAQARKLRERTRIWLKQWREAPARNYAAEIEALNEVLAQGMWRREVVNTGGTLRIGEHAELDNTTALLALIAWQIAMLVTEKDPALIKSCEGSGCTLWFLDNTKAHRRRFCSAAVCGNRAKVAAFRERQR